MKKLIALLTLVVSFQSFATLTYPQYEERHVKTIEAAIISQCGSFLTLDVVSSVKEVIRVDQGIRDARYTTVIDGVQRFDQFRDQYKITVESLYSDSYYHTSGDWGSYHVRSIECTRVN